MKKFLLVSSLFTLLFPSAFGQGDFRTGYMITLNHDSISGFVEYRADKKNGETCSFRKGKKGKSKLYFPDEIMTYGIVDDKRFERKQLTDSSGSVKYVFAEIIVKGMMSLYRYDHIFYVETDKITRLPRSTSEIIETDRGRLKRTSRVYVGLLNYLLRDCHLTADNADYVETDIGSLVQSYNRCKGVPSLVFNQAKPVAQLNYQLFSGWDISNLETDWGPSNTFRKSGSTFLGAGVDFSSPRLYDKFFFSIELWYIKKLYNGYIDGNDASSIHYTNYQIEASFVKIPFGFRYNLFHEGQSPFVRLGFSHYFNLPSTVEVTRELETFSTVVTVREKEKLEGRDQNGYWASVGFSKAVSRKFKCFVEFRYEHTDGFIGTIIESESSTENFSLILGVRY